MPAFHKKSPLSKNVCAITYSVKEGCLISEKLSLPVQRYNNVRCAGLSVPGMAAPIVERLVYKQDRRMLIAWQNSV